MLDNKLRCIYILLFIMFNISCSDIKHSDVNMQHLDTIINCYIIKPVPNNSEYYWPNQLTFRDNDSSILENLANINTIRFDTAMRYVTSFEFQKRILVNSSCIEKMSNPDSLNLMDIYFNSTSRTRIMSRSIVKFIQSYKKNVFNYGNVTIYGYRFDGVSEVSQHYMYIIIKEGNEQQLRYGADYEGFVICSDGLNWRNYSNNNYSVPLFIQRVRGENDFSIVLYYDGKRFIPIAHFRNQKKRLL